jgi:hypothetical protein
MVTADTVNVSGESVSIITKEGNRYDGLVYSERSRSVKTEATQHDLRGEPAPVENSASCRH